MIRCMLLAFQRSLILTLILSFVLAYDSACLAQTDTLRGYVQESTDQEAPALTGKVLDQKNQQPLSNARLSIPEAGISAKTDASGQFRIPRPKGIGPKIMSIQKEGYSPFTMTVEENSPPQFNILLQKQVKILVLDTELRHLGDGSFSPVSNGAQNFMKPADGPALMIPFSLNGLSISAHPYLEIGSIIGIDTAMAHFLSGSHIGVNATPMLIKVNDHLVAKVQVNGDNQKIQIPPGILRTSGDNVLQIEAGYNYPEPNRIDFDDMELMNLVLHL